MMPKMLVLLALMSACLAPEIAFGDTVPDTSKLSLTAQATISRPADELQLTVGVVTLGNSAESALSENSTAMQSVIDALQKVGLSDTEYKTGRFSIHPTYTPYPKDPAPNWKPSINGYEVSNSVVVKTQKLELAGRIIDAASKAGANSVENIHFSLHDQRSHWDEVVSLATAHALSDAQVIAAAARVQLGRLLSIALDNTGHVSPRYDNVYFAKTAGNAIPPIEAGDVELTASISVSYEIIAAPAPSAPVSGKK